MPFPVWLLIGFSFLYFSFIFWQYSKMPIRSFVFRPSRTGSATDDKAEQEETGEPQTLTTEAVLEFEGYLRSINHTIKTRFRIGAFGFLIAALGALIAMFLSG